VLVDNEPGVLARIAGLFSGRGYNIESLTVSETEHEKHVSRITIVTTGTAMVIEQAFRRLQAMPNVSFYPSDAVTKALIWVQGGLDLPDALHVSLSSDADAFVTSDAAFIKRSLALGVIPRVQFVQEVGL
jgi:hypothetical protein